ncbi:MAG TPA: hypothetical protein VJ508_19430, partial [Saprospiraceae bacterium]|nr:hypothetical protein [Saprospiraceae bacterium]
RTKVPPEIKGVTWQHFLPVINASFDPANMLNLSRNFGMPLAVDRWSHIGGIYRPIVSSCEMVEETFIVIRPERVRQAISSAGALTPTTQHQYHFNRVIVTSKNLLS